MHVHGIGVANAKVDLPFQWGGFKWQASPGQNRSVKFPQPLLLAEIDSTVCIIAILSVLSFHIRTSGSGVLRLSSQSNRCGG
jgi:hypothetical protein